MQLCSAITRSRPRGRRPARCQRTSVSGRSTIRASRQSRSQESNAIDTRVAASTRLGLTPRSRYGASCRRRKRFSASADRRGLSDNTMRTARSASIRRTIRANAITARSCHRSVNVPQRGQTVPDPIFAEHRDSNSRVGSGSSFMWNLLGLGKRKRPRPSEPTTHADGSVTSPS
jgi:hypothetical protein